MLLILVQINLQSDHSMSLFFLSQITTKRRVKFLNPSLIQIVSKPGRQMES